MLPGPPVLSSQSVGQQWPFLQQNHEKITCPLTLVSQTVAGLLYTPAVHNGKVTQSSVSYKQNPHVYNILYYPTQGIP